ncbi:MAG: hypothetical protein HC887_09555 [Desulfobacteraceae bacterium]|nr:hypothetical protein [Desulfobacteraceae bacterium]
MESDSRHLSPFVYFDGRLCSGCYNSVKICPTRAIRMKNGRPLIWKIIASDAENVIRVWSYGRR